MVGLSPTEERDWKGRKLDLLRGQRKAKTQKTRLKGGKNANSIPIWTASWNPNESFKEGHDIESKAKDAINPNITLTNYRHSTFIFSATSSTRRYTGPCAVDNDQPPASHAVEWTGLNSWELRCGNVRHWATSSASHFDRACETPRGEHVPKQP